VNTLHSPTVEWSEAGLVEALGQVAGHAEKLSPTTRAALITQCAATIVALTAPTLSTPPNGATSHELDGLELGDGAAKMLATSADTLYSKWKKLPFAFKDPLDGKIKFRVSGIERYIAGRTGRTTA